MLVQYLIRISVANLTEVNVVDSCGLWPVVDCAWLLQCALRHCLARRTWDALAAWHCLK
jgi:hypothetical protein